MDTVFDTRLAGYLKEGRPLAGIFIGLPSPALVEMAGLAGFDFCIIDGEHGPSGPETVEQMVRAARAAGIAAVVRVGSAQPQEILKALDAGASGVQVPQVSTAEQARQVVKAARYPPLGSRGVAFSTRAAGYGLRGGAAHIECSNAGTVVVAHVETVEAVQNLDAILAVPGLDALFIGPTDLSLAMGHPGDPGHPAVQATIERCIRRIAAAGVAPGVLVGSPEELHRFAAMGARYLCYNGISLIGAALRSTVAGSRTPR